MYATVCNRCEGEGFDGYEQSHPFGDTYVTEYMQEPCYDCEGNGFIKTDKPVCLGCGHEIKPEETLWIHATTRVIVHVDCQECVATSVPVTRYLS